VEKPRPKTPPVTIHGIKTCDTIRKARAWLDARDIAYAFHDYRVDGLARGVLEGWVRAVGWQTLLNRASTTFRELPDAQKVDIDQAKAIALMLAHPMLIKRPVLAVGDALIVGFKPDAYGAAFS
jgi:arsenate reductase